MIPKMSQELGGSCISRRQKKADDKGESRKPYSVPEDKTAPLEDDAKILD